MGWSGVPISLDERERMYQDYKTGISISEIARRHLVCRATVSKLILSEDWVGRREKERLNLQNKVREHTEKLYEQKLKIINKKTRRLEYSYDHYLTQHDEMEQKLAIERSKDPIDFAKVEFYLKQSKHYYDLAQNVENRLVGGSDDVYRVAGESHLVTEKRKEYEEWRESNLKKMPATVIATQINNNAGDAPTGEIDVSKLNDKEQLQLMEFISKTSAKDSGGSK